MDPNLVVVNLALKVKNRGERPKFEHCCLEDMLAFLPPPVFRRSADQRLRAVIVCTQALSAGNDGLCLFFPTNVFSNSTNVIFMNKSLNSSLSLLVLLSPCTAVQRDNLNSRQRCKSVVT